MRILWTITGAGHLLRESIEVLDRLSYNHEITIAYSNAAKEVIQLYGLNENIKEIIGRNKNNQIVTEEEQKYSYPFSGKITHNKYDLVILSPATANTTAKIVNAIADTLVTNIIAQSGKGQIPCIVVPVDQKEGLITTILPPYIDRKKCTLCGDCVSVCMFDAMNPPKIDMKSCTYCGKCEGICKYNAIRIGEEIELYIRKIDADNAKKLEEIENIKTTSHPYNISVEIQKMIKKES